MGMKSSNALLPPKTIAEVLNAREARSLLSTLENILEYIFSASWLHSGMAQQGILTAQASYTMT